MDKVEARPRLSCRLQVNMHCRCKGCVEKIQKAMASIGSFRGKDVQILCPDLSAEIRKQKIISGRGSSSGAGSKTWKDVNIVCPDLSAEIHKQKITSGQGSSSGTGSTTRSATSLRSCQSLARSDRKTGKDVKIVCPDLSAENHKHKITPGRGSSSGTGSTTRSAQSLRSGQSLARSDRKTGKDVKIVCPDLSAENHKQKIISGRGSCSGTVSTAPSAQSLRRRVIQSDRENLQLFEDKIRDMKEARDQLEIKCLKNELDAANSEVRRSRDVISDCNKALGRAC
ncbi:unnamed protein product [Alopecurus aequalis]